MTTAQLADALGTSTAQTPLALIDHDRITQLADHLRRRPEFREFSRATWDDELFWNASDPPARRSQFFSIGNAINFRFWSIEDGTVHPATGVIAGKAFRGAMYMWRSLRRCLERGDLPLLEASFLAELSAQEFDQIFSDDSGTNPLAVASEERRANLRDLGRRLSDGWDGSFFNVLEASNGSLVEFARLSRDFRAFDDPVYKLTMVNAIVHSGSGTYEFRDEPLPAIDYHLLKHAVRQGMVVPVDTLELKLARSRFLDRDEALQLRQAALAAFVELADQTGISGEILDNRYWLNRNVCIDPFPLCEECPFLGACAQTVEAQMPLELTRYY